MNSTHILARAHGAGVILANRSGRYVVDNWSNGTGDVYGFPVGDDGARGELQRLPADLAEPMASRRDYMAPYPEGLSNEARRAVGRARFLAYYGALVSPGDREAVRRTFGVARLLASPDPFLNDIPLQHWDSLAIAYRSAHAPRLAERGDGWSLGNGVCILKVAAAQLIEAERASADGGEG